MPGDFNSVIEITKLVKNRVENAGAPAARAAARIGKYDRVINSFISLVPSLGEAGCSGPSLPLSGVPFAVKDLIFTAGLPTTCGSRAPVPEKLADRSPALAVTRLLEAGAILAGKNNLHEFAFGITNENDHFGPVLNPWDISRVSGGSSGGSAAAVAAGLVPFSVGTDTRGSIRIPSACCGVTGLKPTYGRIPVSGVVPLSPSLDHVGPIARSTGDVELLFRIMSGDPVPGLTPPSRTGPDRRIFRIGICDYYYRGLDREVLQAVYQALDFFRAEGLSVEEVTLPILEESLEASDVVSRAEGYAFHRENLEAFPEGYGEPVRRRLCSGRDLSAVDLVEALRIREETALRFAEAFRRVDCLVAPTLPVTAVPLGTTEIEIDGCKEPIVHGFVRFNAPQNMAGVPALSLPCGFDSGGLPVGLQLIAGRNREDILFALGGLYQSATDWHLQHPPLD